MTLRALATLEDAFNQALTVVDAIRLDEGTAEHVGEAAVVAVGRLPRRQEVDDVLEAALPEVAVAEQEPCTLVLRRRRDHGLQLAHRIDVAAPLVERDAEVEPEGRARRIDRQRLAILRDPFVEAAEAHVGGAEVRAHAGVVRVDLEIGLVAGDGAEDVAGLVELDGLREDGVRIRRLGDHRALRRRRRRLGHRKQHRQHETSHGDRL